MRAPPTLSDPPRSVRRGIAASKYPGLSRRSRGCRGRHGCCSLELRWPQAEGHPREPIIEIEAAVHVGLEQARQETIGRGLQRRLHEEERAEPGDDDPPAQLERGRL